MGPPGRAAANCCVLRWRCPCARASLFHEPHPRRARQARPDAPAPGCVIAAAEISGAQVQGAELNSQSLSFAPGKRAGDYRFHLGTAGSCGLLLQTLWPALMMANGPSRLSLGGGTHNPAAPPFHFLARSYAPLLARLGAKAELNLLRMGFYPAGGGEIEARIWPAADQLEPFDLIARARRPPAMPNAMRRRCRASSGASWNIWARRWADRGSVARGRHAPARRTGQRAAGDLGARAGLEVFTRFGVKGLTAETVAQELARDVRLPGQRRSAGTVPGGPVGAAAGPGRGGAASRRSTPAPS